MKCAIIQPSYIPWRGYFHQIYMADVFIFFDDVQFDKNGWRNRNRVKTPNGSTWLTIPVHTKGLTKEQAAINNIEIDWSKNWNTKHIKTLRQSYNKAPYFELYSSLLEDFYNPRPHLLADYTIELTIALTRELGIDNTEFILSSELNIPGSKTDRLIRILTAIGADHYISGPSAKDYMEEDKFHTAEIKLEYMTYDYPEYQQLYPPFDPYVSILDLLFMYGPQSGEYIWGKC